MFGISGPTIAFIFICTVLGYMHHSWEGAVVGFLTGGIITYITNFR